MRRLTTSIIASDLFRDEEPFEATHVKKKVKKEDETNEKQLDDDRTAGGSDINNL